MANIALSDAFGRYDLVTNKLSDCPKNILVTLFTATKVSTSRNLAKVFPIIPIIVCNIPKWNINPIKADINTIGSKAFINITYPPSGTKPPNTKLIPSPD